MAHGVWQATIVDGNGNVVPSASIEVKLESSGALAALWQDKGATVPLTNPATADSNGFIRFYALDNVEYQIRATSGAFARQWDDVLIMGALTADTIHELSNRRTDAEIAASVTPADYAYPELDVRRYGAVGDYNPGSETDGQVPDAATDNLAAFNSAIAVALAKGGGTIRIEGGDFYVSNSIDARGISNLHVYIAPGTTLRATKYTSLGGLLVMGGTGPVAADITNLRVYGGGTLRTFRPDHATVPAHQTNHAYSVGNYVLSTDTNGKPRAYYCKTAGTSGSSYPPDVINGSDTDGGVEWQDADNDNVIGINGDGVVVEGLTIPEASGKFVTCQTPNWTDVQIRNLRCGKSNDKGIEVKGNTGTSGQEAAYGDGVQIENVRIEETGYEGIEIEQGSFSSALNKNARLIGCLVRSAGAIDTAATGIRVNRCENVEIRGNKVLDSGGNGYHIRLSKNITGDLHSESAGIFGVHLQENIGFAFSAVYVKNSTDSGVRESDDAGGGFIGRLIIDTAADGWETTSRDGDAPVIASYKMSSIAGASFVGALPTLMQNVPAAKHQSFVLTITNDGGTLKHQITDDILNATASSFADRITGASATLTATPTGSDVSTAFAAGGKIGSAQTSEFIFDHANAASSLHGARSAAGVVNNDTTTPVMVAIVRRSVNVNGTTLNRWHLQFRKQSDGTVFALTTANIGSGTKISVQVSAYFP